MDWRDLADPIGYLRYGMSTADKEVLARNGSLPGAPVDKSEEQKVADRYAAGYLFTRQWPTLGPILQPVANMIDTDTGIINPFGGSSPELQSYASEGQNHAMLENRSAAAQAAALRMAAPTPRPAPPPTPLPYRR